MARESIEQRRARLAPGAAWLTAERERRGLSGRELARRLGINADRIFAYERAQDEPGKDFVELLAAEYRLTQVEVWRGLGKPLPAEFETDKEAIAWAVDNYRDVLEDVLGPEVVEKIAGSKRPPPAGLRRQSGDRRPRVTRPGGKPRDASRGEESAI